MGGIIIAFILLVFIIVYYGGRGLYFSITEKGKFWKPCYHCGGRGELPTGEYGTNGVEIWPIYNNCPICHGRGKVEDHSINIEYSKKDIKNQKNEKRILGMKLWQFFVIITMVLLIISALSTFIILVTNNI